MLDGVGLALKTFAAKMEFAGVRAALALRAEDHIDCDAARRRRFADVDQPNGEGRAVDVDVLCYPSGCGATARLTW